MSIEGGNISLDKVIIINNNAKFRGGVYAWNASVQIYNSIISGNIAINGGGVYFDNSKTIMATTSLQLNTANNNGGGIYVTNNNGGVDYYTGLISGGNHADGGGCAYFLATSRIHFCLLLILKNTIKSIMMIINYTMKLN